MPEVYLRDGDAIYARSFEIIRGEADLARFTEAEATIAVRMIHACGMVELAGAIEFGRGLIAGARRALADGAPVLCDSEMLAQGIIRRRLPAGNPVICTLNDPAAFERAAALGTTRSAAALDLWGDRIAGAVVAIGNAPTALFRLLELLDAGVPKPAAILGIPVGFVGAAESKTALAENPRGVPFLTVHGRVGGSAIAAAAVNALAMGETRGEDGRRPDREETRAEDGRRPDREETSGEERGTRDREPESGEDGRRPDRQETRGEDSREERGTRTPEESK